MGFPNPFDDTRVTKTCRVCRKRFTYRKNRSFGFAPCSICGDCMTDFYRGQSGGDPALLLKLVARIEELERKVAKP